MDENNFSQNDDSIPKMPVPQKNSNKDDDSDKKEDLNLAADLVRKKISTIYNGEPQAVQELNEINSGINEPSKHQKFILNLQRSGLSQVEIQTKWHEYYMSLDDKDKNGVWQEFYAANKQQSVVPKSTHTVYVAPEVEDEMPKPKRTVSPKRKTVLSPHKSKSVEKPEGKRTAAAVKKELLSKVQNRAHSSWYQRFHSLVFGLGVGLVVIIIFLFSFFNDRFIAPFITPSQNVSAQSLIIDPNGGAVSQSPLVIIPKINVEIPVVYTVPTIDENLIENNLEDGTVHYPTTAYPGQNGNGAIFGHSSNNILNPGKYKFAFVLLHDLQVGDTFTLDYNGTAYVYQIFQKQIVSPNDVSVLNNIPGHPATFTLITCDPPGTSINRLVVVGDQISPAVGSNTAGPSQDTAPKPSTLPSNSPSLWSRFVHWL